MRGEVQVKGTPLPFRGLFLTWISSIQLAPMCSECGYHHRRVLGTNILNFKEIVIFGFCTSNSAPLLSLFFVFLLVCLF